MEPNEVIDLLDSFWFYSKTFRIRSNSSDAVTSRACRQNQENSGNEVVLKQSSVIHTRSRSHDQMPNLDKIFIHGSVSSSPKPHLETILSGKESSPNVSGTGAGVREFKKPGEGFRRGRRRGPSKSLSELEFEEVKGFMDLGFVFSEEDKNSSLAEIVPGLHRLGQKIDDGEREEETGNDNGVAECSGRPARARPYLSEAWEAANPLMNWRVPAAGDEVVMKDSLKWWAHTVALSAVR